jgi:hypothetical protein
MNLITLLNRADSEEQQWMILLALIAATRALE